VHRYDAALRALQLDATITAQKADLLDLTAGDTLDVIVNVFGFDPNDAAQWVFTAKVSPSDSDVAPTTVQKTITPSETAAERHPLRAALADDRAQGHFLLSQADTAKLVAARATTSACSSRGA
jgi:hypothetical protein